MSALRLSETLPHERKSLEVVHSYAEQRLSGNPSDPIVSSNFSGNATFIQPLLILQPVERPKRCEQSFQIFRKNAKCSFILKFLSRNRTALLLPCFPPSRFHKHFLSPPALHSTLADGPHRAILGMFANTLQAGLLASALPEAVPANPRWGVVQPVGHLTVNEDGEGSNPSAPAKLPVNRAARSGRMF